MLDDIVAESVGKHFPRQRRYGDPGALPLKYVAEIFKIRITAAYGAMFEFEGWDAGPANDLVVRVHTPRCAVGLRILDLCHDRWY